MLQQNAAAAAKKMAFAVLRPFYLDGKPTEVGAKVMLDRQLAAELASAAKIADVDSPLVADAVEAHKAKTAKRNARIRAEQEALEERGRRRAPAPPPREAAT